ncbi:hypothetical protein Bca52824_037465 [Brassica carinata]|uniref:Uncharacterized protein n=1 Tax=Brassica carinata TaxID=52824 RepID=A0A8X7S7U0_BRACI|nr:hypothetical protein Bca52824_037465 [Brassica carinata]
MSTRGRKRLRRPSYETTFLGGLTDRSASTSGTATQSEIVPESQSQERSPAASAPLPPWVPPALYVLKKPFNEKAMDHLKNTVGDWKDKWRFQGDAVKPIFISETTWTGLKAYWMLPQSIMTANNCSAARHTPDAEGNLPLPHTSRQIPHAGVALQMVIFF